MTEIVGNDTGFSENPLTLTICKPGIFPLTFIDTIGCVSNFNNEQDKVILKNIFSTYLGKSENNIVGVVQTATDIQCADILKIITDYDL